MKKSYIKKIILAVLLITLTSVVLAGCISKPPHKMFSDPWLNEEIVTYEVKRELKDYDGHKDVVIKGESTMTTKRITNQTIKVGNETIENFTGTLVTIDTTLEDGSYMNGAVAFKSTLEPIVSYKKTSVVGYPNNSPEKDTTQEYTLKYGNEACNYTADNNGVKTTGTIKLKEWSKAPYYDNLMVYHIARSSYYEKKDNLIFTPITVPVISTGDFTQKSLSVGRSSSFAFKLGEKDDENDKGIKADMITITLNQTFPGSGAPLIAMISTESKEDYQGLDLSRTRHLLQFTEGDMTYTIKSISEK